MYIETGAFGHGFAHVQRLEQCQFGHVLLEQRRKTQHDFFALLGCQLRPHAAIERLAGDLHGDVDVFGLAGRDVIQHLTVARGNIGKSFSTQGVDKTAIDEGLPWQVQGGDTLLDRSDINENALNQGVFFTSSVR
jgi:hypothetical protein